MNSREYGRDTLKEAIRQLPAYAPPPSVWGGIEAELEARELEQPLREAIAQLPAYQPPEKVWLSIQAGLQPSEARRPRRLRYLARASAAAAAAVLLIAAFFLWLDFDGRLAVSYAHTSAPAPATGLYEADWNADETAMGRLIAEFSQDPLAMQSPEHQSLLDEWRELNEARAEVLSFMERYGRDGRLIRQLGEIERERSALAREMAGRI